MKIAFITSLFPPGGGGAATVYHQLCRQLQDVCVFAPLVGGPEAARFDNQQPFGVVRLPVLANRPLRWGPRWIRIAWKVFVWRQLCRVLGTFSVWRHLHRVKPDVVCLGGLASLYWLAPLVRWVFRAPIVFYIHGEEVAPSEGFGAISRWFFSRSVAAMRQADAVVAVSTVTARRLEQLGVAPDRIHVIYSGVDHQRFSAGPADPGIRQRHQLDGKRAILTVARLDPRKGHDTVLRALPAIVRAVPDAVYVIVGDGQTRRTLETLAASLGIADHVVFAGAVPDAEIGAYYRTCELFVQPNRRMPDGDDEGFGLVFLEASACRLPVIGGRSGGVPEAVQDGESGLLVDGNSVEETAQAVIRLLADRDLANRLAERGWARAQRFDWSETATQFSSLCRRLLAHSIALAGQRQNLIRRTA